jgi:hypothetical protein
LLLAAGYFRARIKGLTPFDKIVGGMTWCIQTCNVDVDVDLLFQENSTIGQKIALTEKIVAVLPRMKCPHRLEPHQIQGLDFIHIYPVIQWLVTRAIETREEMGDYIRSYSESQFTKYHSTPKDKEFEEMKDTAINSISQVKSIYKPHRQYRKPQSTKQADEEIQIHSTLLEYGRRYGLGRSVVLQKNESQDNKRKAVSDVLGGSDGDMTDKQRQEEEKRIKALMKGMASAGDESLSSVAVGSIVGMQSDEILQVASEYEVKKADLESAQPSEKVMGAQSHLRMVAALQKQIASVEKKCSDLQVKHDEMYQEYLKAQNDLEQIQENRDRIAREMEKLNAMENDENKEVLEELRSLVAMNENLKKQETQFKAHCKEEKARLEELINQLKHGDGEDSEESERIVTLKGHLQADHEKLNKIKALLSRKNREIAHLQRKIDEIPSRTELTQYQRRFIELYSQVSSMLTETRQYYTLYNTLEDQKAYMEKEVGILSSIHDNFNLAMSSDKNKESFLQQVQQILDGIKQDKDQLSQRCLEEKKQRDKLNTVYLELIEKQRTYYKTVKDFQEVNYYYCSRVVMLCRNAVKMKLCFPN